MRLVCIDTYYPTFLQSLYFNPAMTYESERDKLLGLCFGTFDGYTRNLRQLGWTCEDIVGNADELQGRWEYEKGLAGTLSREAIAMEQIEEFKPDVVFLQDLNFFSLENMDRLREKYILSGQLSCPWPGEDRVRKMACLFSSFPHYVDRFERMGIKAVFNPLAFDPIVLDRLGPPPTERIHDVVFIGGVGNPSHWRNGMETLEHVALNVPTFKWWGYGYNTLPAGSPLRSCYQGEAWGLDMYRIFLQSKIVLNRHGEVAQGYTNNQRCFEATGCGAALLTERSLNLSDYFSRYEVLAYGSPEEAVDHIKAMLAEDEKRCFIAENGQRRTMRDHTYEQRMKTVSDTLKEMLVEAAQ